MDIGTVLKKLRSTPRGYSQPLEVAQDMRQVICRSWEQGEAEAGVLSMFCIWLDVAW
jgi:hypothetical protein